MLAFCYGIVRQLLSQGGNVTTLEKVQAQIKKLQAQADALIAKQSSAVLEKINDLMSKHGLTTADIDAHIGGKKRGPKTRAKAAVKVASTTAKYRDPKSGATWSGRGRAPSWIASVKDRSKFLVDASSATAGVAPPSKAKALGKYVRGPQPAKYRNPKSGATWSGRGPAPAWLAAAKDRSAFLIAGAADGTTAGAGAVAKKAAAKKVVARRAAAKKASVLKKVSAKRAASATKKAAAKKAAARTVKATKVPTAKKAAAKKAVSAKAAAPKRGAPKKVAGRRAAPTAKKTAAKKAPATKAVVAQKVVAKTDIAAAPEGVTAQATA